MRANLMGWDTSAASSRCFWRRAAQRRRRDRNREFPSEKRSDCRRGSSSGSTSIPRSVPSGALFRRSKQLLSRSSKYSPHTEFIISLEYVEGVGAVDLLERLVVRQVVFEELFGRIRADEGLDGELSEVGNLAKVPNFRAKKELFAATQELLEKCGVQISFWRKIKASF